jgi:hypothetical protein
VETVITVALIIAMIGIGMLLIHRIHAQQGQRTAAFHYSDTLPGISRLRGRNRRPAEPTGSSTDEDGEADAGGRG